VADEAGYEIDQVATLVTLVENLRMDCSSLLLVCMCVSWVLCSGSAGSGKLYLCP